jgi:hypothetical protein
MLAPLPTLHLNPKVDGIPLPVVPGQRSEWEAARRFADDNPSDYFGPIQSARLSGILWSVIGGIVYRWARELDGCRGGLLALGMWCFGSNVLAHAPLVTPDAPATVAGLVATYTFWRHLRTGSRSPLVASAVATSGVVDRVVVGCVTAGVRAASNEVASAGRIMGAVPGWKHGKLQQLRMLTTRAVLPNRHQSS